MLIYICLLTIALACTPTNKTDCNNIAKGACQDFCDCIPNHNCALECLSCIRRESDARFARLCCHCLFSTWSGCNEKKKEEPTNNCYMSGQLYSCGAFFGNQQCCNGSWKLCTVQHCGYCSCGH